ncbi:uncharacterized protein TNCV_4993461 [Trichonephila clavipes]|nr:uncharacterized protein TNCV_4993461 [Trichonephila clavipes]
MYYLDSKNQKPLATLVNVGLIPMHLERAEAVSCFPLTTEHDFLGIYLQRLVLAADVAAVAEWYRHRIVAGFVTSSSPVPLKTRRVGQRCTLNLSRAETSSRWCGVVVRRWGCQLRCRPRHLTMVQNYVVRRQKPSCS